MSSFAKLKNSARKFQRWEGSGCGRQIGPIGTARTDLLPPYQKKTLLQSLEEGSENSGGDLLSHTVTHVVPSALESLTSVFGMGTGVTPPLSPPKSKTMTIPYLQLLNEVRLWPSRTTD
jgi:hypothetical protein